ncbi:MAG: hypothetical protein ACC700_20315 [Anaerolineales bacterium]
MKKTKFLLLAPLLFMAACGSTVRSTPKPTETPYSAQSTEPISATHEPTTTPEPTEAVDEVELYMDWSRAILVEWGDAVDIAMNSTRIELAESIDRLQGIRRKARENPASDPQLIEAHKHLLLAMDYTIDMFLEALSKPGGFNDFDELAYVKLYVQELAAWGEALLPLTESEE